jgi:quercetin dioxygenase-like cupin family protein
MSTETLVARKAMKKNLNAPDKTRRFSNGLLEVIDLEETSFARVTLKPGWRWSQDVRPISGTESCQVAHYQYVLSGRLMIVMDDGSEMELHPGDVAVIPPGHDAWVIGDDEFVAIDFGGMKEYAK